jgi:hypothetical protein
MLRKSGSLGFDFDFEAADALLEGKHSGWREEDDDAARLHVSVPAGPACCCPVASRKAIIIIPCLALGDGHEGSALKRMFNPGHAECGVGVAWRGLQ